jgi:anti-anti-sigma factor
VRTEERLDRTSFSWTAVPDGDALAIRFRGELDLAVVDECRVALMEPLSGGENLIVFDLSELSFVDSTGLRLLVESKLRAESNGKRLKLGPVSAPVLKLLETAGLTSWFDFADGCEPRRVACPVCDGDIVPGGRRCPRCGGAL